MSYLVIRPFDYQGRRLDEIGERIVLALPSGGALEIGEEIRMNPLDRWLSLEPVPVTDRRPVDFFGFTVCYRKPEFSTGIGDRFMRYLESMHGGRPGKLLVVTSLPAKGGSMRLAYGTALDKTAVVSAYGETFGEPGTDLHVDRVVKVGIREFGHLLGLEVHNGAPRKTSSGKLCPMNDSPEGMSAGEMFDSLDSSFCEDCYDALLNE